MGFLCGSFVAVNFGSEYQVLAMALAGAFFVVSLFDGRAGPGVEGPKERTPEHIPRELEPRRASLYSLHTKYSAHAPNTTLAEVIRLSRQCVGLANPDELLAPLPAASSTTRPISPPVSLL